MKTREEMVYDLTKHELEYLFDMNGDFGEVAQFFADGGYRVYTDEALLRQWQFQFTDDYPTKETI
jgi:hypothetical protein